jgi:hypothetical protein
MYHLTGDYPITDYTFWGKAVNFFMILFAVSMVAIPSGLLADGFQQVIENDAEQRALRKARKDARANKDPVKTEANRSWFAERDAAPKASGSPRQETVYKFVNGLGDLGGISGKLFHNFIAVLILLNVVAVILESEDSIRDANGMSSFFDVFEWVSVVIFTIEFVLRLYSASFDERADYSMYGYMTSFFGIVDILAIFPCYIEGILNASGVHFNSMIFRVFRVFRILLLEHFTKAFTLLDDAFRECKDTLAATGLLALVIWVGCATLFYIFEAANDNPDYSDDAFRNIPNSMYYVAVFLGGEWAKTDFTVPGKLVAQFLAIAGIALYAIPIGAFFDAFGGLMEDEADDEDDEEEDGSEEDEQDRLAAMQQK